MKKKNKILIVILGACFVLSSCIIYVPREEEYPPPQREGYPSREDEGPLQRRDIAFFYEYLSPYGIWIDYPPYGYVWVPSRVSPRWRPYTYGRWVWTTYGWTWISYHDWGWLPFHYGRWGWSARLGWFWVPDVVWGPAWVTWRWGTLYIGWAPLPPEVEFLSGIGFRSLPEDLPSHYWIFIEGRYFHYNDLGRYALPPERNRTVIRFTVSKANLTVRNQILHNPGVDLDRVRRVTRSEVSRYEIEDSTAPGPERVSGGVVRVYRPEVSAREPVRPRSFLQKEEAENKVSEWRLRALEEAATAESPDRRLSREHERELRLLEQSQAKEEAELRRSHEAEKRLVSDPAGQEKVEKEYSLKARELKKQHEEEKAKILERHREEEKVVKKKVGKKEEERNPPESRPRG